MLGGKFADAFEVSDEKQDADSVEDEIDGAQHGETAPDPGGIGFGHRSAREYPPGDTAEDTKERGPGEKKKKGVPVFPPGRKGVGGNSAICGDLHDEAKVGERLVEGHGEGKEEGGWRMGCRVGGRG